jgi:glycosyltransferase involved in cell wall biosynthesis
MAGRRKVLWLIKGLFPGGAEKLLAMSLPYLDREAFDYQVVYLLKKMNDLAPEFEKHGIPVSCLNMEKAYDLRVIFKLAKLLRERKIDILHTHLPYAGIVGRPAAVLAGVKTIISTEHGLMGSYHPLTRLGSVLTYPLNNATIGVSQAVANSILKYKMTRPKSIHVVHNAIDIKDRNIIQTDPESVKKSLRIEGTGLIVGTVSHIRPEKGHQYLVEAARLVLDKRPEVRFVVVGRETTKNDLLRLEEQAQRLGIRDRIIFTGFRPDALQIMNTFDVFVLPSLWEAFGIVLLEAMNLGKPLVATNVDGIPEVIDDGVNGFMVPPRDPEKMAARILDLLNDDALRNRMGEQGRKKVRENFGIERMVKQVEQVYLSVLKDKA